MPKEILNRSLENIFFCYFGYIQILESRLRKQVKKRVKKINNTTRAAVFKFRLQQFFGQTHFNVKTIPRRQKKVMLKMKSEL
jgi:hypothetical protein